jgi:hypothetical protein
MAGQEHEADQFMNHSLYEYLSREIVNQDPSKFYSTSLEMTTISIIEGHENKR